MDILFRALKVAIDLFPFGKIEENYTVNFNKRYTDLHAWLRTQDKAIDTSPLSIIPDYYVR